MRLFSMQVKHWWEKLSKIMLEEGFYTKPEYVGYIIAFEHDFRDLLGKVHDLEAENRRLKAVAGAAQEYLWVKDSLDIHLERHICEGLPCDDRDVLESELAEVEEKLKAALEEAKE